jgi:hypothetical protein
MMDLNCVALFVTAKVQESVSGSKKETGLD